MKTQTIIRIVVIGVLVCASAFALWRFKEFKQYLDEFVAWTQRLGLAGMAVFAGAYVLATIFFVPGSILSLAAGFAFGVVQGTILISLASVTGASLAFLLGRTLLRGVIANKVAGNENFAKVDRAVGKQGWKIVLLTRLSPLFPFNLLNYAFGLTDVRFWHYVFASWIGMLPGTITYVYLGSAVKEFASIVSGDAGESTGTTVLFVIGLFVAVAVTIYVTRIAKRALDEELPENTATTPL